MKMYGKERAELIYGLKSSDEVDARICDMLFDDGAAFVGFSDVSDVAENHGYRSCVTIGFKLFDGILKGIQGAPTYEYFHHYRTVNAALDRMALRVAAFLNSQGFDAIAVPASQSSDSDPFKGTRRARGFAERDTSARTRCSSAESSAPRSDWEAS